jgi:hypothetical protein
MDRHPCRDCGSTLTAEVPCPGGPHHAKLACAGCGRFLRWLPRPDPGIPLSELAASLRSRPGPAELTGTPTQVRWARSIRDRMLSDARRSGDRDRAAVLAGIADASWFIANRNRPPGEIRWPAPGQLAAAR